MTLPNFLVIGAGRSGTTSLHHYLKAHRQVYLPAVKSPSHFFCHGRPPETDPYKHYVTRNYFVPDPAAYEALFDGVREEIAIGEVSPVYLATVHAAARIANRLPDVKLIALLRHPVDRVWARYVGRYRDGLERREDFTQLIHDELRQPLIREEAFGTYLAGGFVSHFLRSYLDRFPRDRIRIHLFEDFVADPAAVMHDLFLFLGVDPDFMPRTAVQYNRSGGLIRNRALRSIWTRSALLRARIRPYLSKKLQDRAFRLVTRQLVPMALDEGLRASLTELYRPDIEELQQLVDRDLSHWLHPAGDSSLTRSTAEPDAV